MKDLHSLVDVRKAISPKAVSDNTALVSSIIDRQGFDALEFAMAIGSVADADATFAVLVEEGDESDLSDAAAVADNNLLGTESEAGFRYDDDDGVRKIGYKGDKRYVRLTITPSGNASAAYIAALAILGSPHIAPVE
jgi:hypothetical protein